MSAGDFSYAASALVGMSKFYRYTPHWLSLGGTPLNEAIISAMEIVPEFQKKYKLQIVNTVFLTDGEGHTMREFYGSDKDGNKLMHSFGRYSFTEYNRIVFTDPVTRKQEIVQNSWNCSEQTSALIKLFKYRTNCNVLGFYVLSGRDFGKYCYKFFPTLPSYQHGQMKNDFRKNKYTIVTNAGFDEYYLLRSESLNKIGRAHV